MFKEHILGGIDPSLFFACFLFALTGVMIMLLVGTTLRQTTSSGSPTEFSWKYLLWDNLKRIVLNVLLILATLRFMPEITGWELSAWKGFVVGLGYDGLLLWIKQKTSLLDPKPKP